MNVESRTAVSIDPRTKILLMLTVTTIMIAGGVGEKMNYLRPMVAVFPILMLILSKHWKAAIRFMITYVVLYLLERWMLPYLSSGWGFILGGMIGIYTHILPGFVMGYYLIGTTTVNEFVAAMEKMHISNKVIIPISVVFRFFPTVKEEYAAIRDAMRMRGIMTLQSPLKMLEYRVVPLMVSVAKIGEELSSAALTRGLGAPIRRTNTCSIGFHRIDIGLILPALFCWGIFMMEVIPNVWNGRFF